jgi:hypothetical protein
MSALLYLFGTSHNYQCGGLILTNSPQSPEKCTPEQIQSFESELKKIFQEHNIRCIVEEMTPEGRKTRQVEETIARKLAIQFSIHHHDVDLTEAEKGDLSLFDCPLLSPFKFNDGGNQVRSAFTIMTHEIRERVWAARIANNNSWPALFILGANHVEPFRRIWIRLGGEATVVHEDYVP